MPALFSDVLFFYFFFSVSKFKFQVLVSIIISMSSDRSKEQNSSLTKCDDLECLREWEQSKTRI